MTINDPGNADSAITVGSTHATRPDAFGVSYFSSQGPTADGRPKPDILAPGEAVASCATGRMLNRMPFSMHQHPLANYVESSGTSMAAPHVSGAIAAMMSVRPEMRGQPTSVKQALLSTASPLRRDTYFEGQGLLNVEGAITTA